MPRKRPPHRVRRWTKLQVLQLQHFYLACNIPVFVDDDQRLACWQQNRERLIAAAAPGTRPVGWWWFESPEARNSEIPEHEQLKRIGALRPNELKVSR